MMNDILTIIGKELSRVFTDKKLVFTTFFLPALSLVLIYSVMGIMVKQSMDQREEHIGNVVVLEAPESFKAFWAMEGSAYKLSLTYDEKINEDALKNDIYEGKLEGLVVFDKGFDVLVASYKTTGMPNLKTYYNPTEDYSQSAHNKLVDKILMDYEKSLLTARFGSEDFLTAFTVDLGNEDQLLAPKEKISGDLLGGLVPMLLSVFLFAGGMGIGIDLITGEKERGTMATLLVTPIKREAIAFGKMISLGIVSLVSTASSLVGMAISFPFLEMAFSKSGDTQSIEGATQGVQILMLSPMGVFQFLVLSMMLTLIYVGIICIISVYANSVKEAGTLVTPAYMVVMLLGLVTVFSTEMPKVWAFAAPVYGTLMGMKYALSAELTWAMFGINLLVSALVVGGIVWVIKQMFNSEKIMFGA